MKFPGYGMLAVWCLAGCAGDASSPMDPTATETTSVPTTATGSGTASGSASDVPSATEPAATTTSSPSGSDGTTSGAATETETAASTTATSTSTPAETGTDPVATTGTTTDTATDTTSEVVSRALLSETGLYADMATETLAEGVQSYAPQFQLWSDNAEKRRWIYIPPGTQINTSNIDEWQFPIGTKLWKEFTRDGIRIETRLLEKLPRERAKEGFEGWLYMAYVWNDDQTDAVATPDGLQNGKGTDHDVPDQKACGQCHDMRVEKPLGFSAVQLSHDGEGATLTSLLAEGWLTDAPAVPLTVPGDENQRAILGYFHANCGHCHRQNSPVNSRVQSLQLWLESATLGSFEETNMYRSLVGQYSESGQGSILPYRVVEGDPDNSELMRRLMFRAEDTPAPAPTDPNAEAVEVPMPPLGTEIIDTPEVDRVRQWILSLPPAG